MQIKVIDGTFEFFLKYFGQWVSTGYFLFSIPPFEPHPWEVSKIQAFPVL